MTNRKVFPPFGVSCIIFLVISFAAWNALRLSMSVFVWKTIAAYDAHPVYIFLSGLSWLLLGLFLLWSLVHRSPFSRLAVLGTVMCYSIWYWLDRLLVQQLHANWSVVLLLNFALLLLTALILGTRKAKLYSSKDSL